MSNERYQIVDKTINDLNKYFQHAGQQLQLSKEDKGYSLHLLRADTKAIKQTIGNGTLYDIYVLLRGMSSMLVFLKCHPLLANVKSELKSTHTSFDQAISGEWQVDNDGLLAMQEGIVNAAKAIEQMTGAERIL